MLLLVEVDSVPDEVPLVDEPVVDPDIAGSLVVDDCEVEVESSTFPDPEVVALPEPIPKPVPEVDESVEPEVVDDGTLPEVEESIDPEVVESSDPGVPVVPVVDVLVPTP